jgi:hypothetical protein
MPRVCHECHTFVRNPFYSIALVIGSKPGRVAFSSLEYALCDANHEFATKNAKNSLDRLRLPTGYVVGRATEEKGAMLKGNIESPLIVYDRFGPYSFLEKEDAMLFIPTTAKDLFENLQWVEKAGKEWREAIWASELYKHMSKF